MYLLLKRTKENLYKYIFILISKHVFKTVTLWRSTVRSTCVATTSRDETGVVQRRSDRRCAKWPGLGIIAPLNKYAFYTVSYTLLVV